MGLLSKLAHVSVIISTIGSLALLKAVQLNKKCLIISSPFLHNKQVGAIALWLKAAQLLWSMYVLVTRFSFVLNEEFLLHFKSFVSQDVVGRSSNLLYVGILSLNIVLTDVII